MAFFLNSAHFIANIKKLKCELYTKYYNTIIHVFTDYYVANICINSEKSKKFQFKNTISIQQFTWDCLLLEKSSARETAHCKESEKTHIK